MSSVYPELVTGRGDDFAPGAWRVHAGSVRRGGASCNLTDRILEVPLGCDDVARVVRAHELMHARVSPHQQLSPDVVGELSSRALECAEELRVNTLVGRVGFDVFQLRDGTEKIGGRRLAEAGDWSEALCFMMAVIGTGAEKEFFSGVRQGDATWIAGLRAVRKRALTIMSGPTAALGETTLNADRVPRGYADATMLLARVLTQSMTARPPTTSDQLRAFRRSLEPGARRPPSGRFAELVFDESIDMVRRPRASGVRSTRPSTSGATIRYPGRLLTDERRRAFATRSSRHGGIVVIDQSGSMDLDQREMNELVRRAPDALVLGYSHRPGDRSRLANAWLLAERGAAATRCPTGNVGNGVDGPVLRWALSARRRGEPLVWVTDGQVTDSNDHPSDELTTECAALVIRHRIRLVRDLHGAGRSLRQGTMFGLSRSVDFGRLGRKIGEINGRGDVTAGT